MKNARPLALLCVTPVLAAVCYGASGDGVASAWNQKEVAHYLDSREILGIS